MTLVLKRLEKRLQKEIPQEQYNSLPRNKDGTLSWSFFEHKSDGKHLNNISENNPATKAFFKILVIEDASLVLEYNTARSLLIGILQKYNETIEINKNNPSTETLQHVTQLKIETIALVDELLQLSILLDQKYCHLINPTILSKQQLEKDQERYNAWLEANTTDHKTVRYQAPVKQDVIWARVVRLWTEWINRYRLFIARDWRFQRLLIPFVNDANYGRLILLANPLVVLFLTYAGAIFFIPRLIMNILTLLKHVIPGSWMTPEEIQLGWFTRLNAQWMRLWPNISNDTAWITNGILLSFYFVGQLLPFVVFLSVGILSYDLVMAGLRFNLDTHRFNQLIQEYDPIKESDPMMEQYLDHLKNTIAHEKQLLHLALFNFTILLIGMSLALPWLLVLSPALPLIGAVMAVLITFINFGGRDYLSNQRNLHFKAWDELLPLPIKTDVPVDVIVEPIAVVEPHHQQVSSVIINKFTSAFSSFFNQPRSKSPRGITTNLSGQQTADSPIKKHSADSTGSLNDYTNTNAVDIEITLNSQGNHDYSPPIFQY